MAKAMTAVRNVSLRIVAAWFCRASGLAAVVCCQDTGLDLLDLGFAEKALRQEDQHCGEHRKRGDVLIFNREVGRPEDLDEADHETTEHGARDRADAAEDGGGECFDAGEEAHV